MASYYNYTEYSHTHYAIAAKKKKKKKKITMSSSLYIEFHELYWSIIRSNAFNIADPDLNVISCGGG